MCTSFEFGQAVVKGCEMAPATLRALEMKEIGVHCAECRQMLFEKDELAERKVFEFDGTLDFIELYHADCARKLIRESE